MNGVLEKRRQGILGQMQLSVDLVVRVEKLFQMHFAGLSASHGVECRDTSVKSS